MLKLHLEAVFALSFTQTCSALVSWSFFFVVVHHLALLAGLDLARSGLLPFSIRLVSIKGDLWPFSVPVFSWQKARAQKNSSSLRRTLFFLLLQLRSVNCSNHSKWWKGYGMIICHFLFFFFFVINWDYDSKSWWFSSDKDKNRFYHSKLFPFSAFLTLKVKEEVSTIKTDLCKVLERILRFQGMNE